MEAFTVLPDPQTNGGLLISCTPSALIEVQQLLNENGLGTHINPIGKMIAKSEFGVYIN